MLADQGWDGIEWRVTDQDPADPPGFWAGNRATWPLTGLEDLLPEIARVTRDAGLEISGLGGYVGATTTPMSSACSPPPPRSAPAGSG